MSAEMDDEILRLQEENRKLKGQVQELRTALEWSHSALKSVVRPGDFPESILRATTAMANTKATP